MLFTDAHPYPRTYTWEQQHLVYLVPAAGDHPVCIGCTSGTYHRYPFWSGSFANEADLAAAATLLTERLNRRAHLLKMGQDQLQLVLKMMAENPLEATV